MLFVSIYLQPGFAAAPLVAHVARQELLRAKKHNYGVILLQYEKHGPTLMQITSGIKHHKVTPVWKNSDDGSIEILDTAFAEGYNVDVIRICGVNTDLCVLQTVLGLRKFSPESKILIRKDGCYSYADNSFKQFKNLSQVTLIGEHDACSREG